MRIDYKLQKKIVEKICNLAKMKFPEAIYTVIVTNWLDGDFQVEWRYGTLQETGHVIYILIYKKVESGNTLHYYIEDYSKGKVELKENLPVYLVEE